MCGWIGERRGMCHVVHETASDARDTGDELLGVRNPSTTLKMIRKSAKPKPSGV